jgi:BON domain
MHDILLPHSRLARLRNSFRHPRQASLAARIPFVRRRVPLRGFWLRRPARVLPAVRDSVARLRPAGISADLIPITPSLPVVHKESVPPTRRRSARSAMPVVACAAAGALAMFYLDPQQGRRRRALARDRVAHVAHIFRRDLPHSVERRGRFLRGKVRGIGHEAAELAHINGRHDYVDDETLVDRVRSEALREAGVPPGRINVDAYEGCVTLRGQLDSEEDIDRLISDTRRVEGVREIRSYLHLPGTLPPNKAQSYQTVPEQMRY